MHTTCLALVMVLEIINNEKNVMTHHLFDEDVTINADGQIHVLETVVKPWTNDVGSDSGLASQQPATSLARLQSPWLLLMRHSWSKDQCKTSQNTKDFLQAFWRQVVEADSGYIK